MEESYCSTCEARTFWLEFENNWQCLGCGRITVKMTWAEATIQLELLQEKWSRLEKHLTADLNDYVKPLKNNIDKLLKENS